MENASYVAICSALIFVVLFLLERYVPLRDNGRSLWKRFFVNIIVSAIALTVGAILIRPAVAQALGSDAGQIGVLNWVALPTFMEVMLGFLLMDLTFYYWHMANHLIPFLWRFHNVHHIDPDLDVSTAFRFHFVEMIFSAGFRVAQVVLLGVSPLIYILYELAFQANTMFHHSNVRLPIGIERGINRVLVTPRMHGIHHSQVKEETNSNYSVVLPWWDWLHRTLRLNVSQSEILIGVPAYSAAEDNSLWSVLTMPFRKQRDYWLETNDSNSDRDDELREAGDDSNAARLQKQELAE